MTKQIISLEISVHGQMVFEISDADFPGVASAVLAAAQAGKDLYFPVSGEDIPEGATQFIPYHAIQGIAVTRTSTEVEAPADALCQTEDADDGEGG